MKVGLFITCLANSLRPSIGIASLKLLQQAGCKVVIPSQQTCCAQPSFNSGYNQQARKIAQRNLDLFNDCEYVVVPSGSCAGMIHHHYPNLFAQQSNALAVSSLSNKTCELCQFLDEVLDWKPKQIVPCQHQFTYHDSCAGLRELKIKQQPRKLMKLLNLDLIEMQHPEECCGFGGTFCIKFSDLSSALATRKVEDAQQTQAHALVLGDYGCMMNIEGRASRLNNNQAPRQKILHISEVLAHFGGCHNHPSLAESH